MNNNINYGLIKFENADNIFIFLNSLKLKGEPFERISNTFSPFIFNITH